MKTRIDIIIHSCAIISILLIFISGCNKNDDNIDSQSPYNSIVFNSNLSYGTVTDIDGNVYKTITIGTQTWMAENLKTTKYRNGDSIHHITDKTEWFNLFNSPTAAYCIYNNTPGISENYGNLYNWYAVSDSRNIAPAGWHVPSDSEWTVLTNNLAGNLEAGGELKETGTTHWKSPNNYATNQSGFTALPSGWRGGDGIFYGISEGALWWSSTFHINECARARSLYYLTSFIYNDSLASTTNGYSVRCIKDNISKH